VVTSRDVAATL